MSYLRYLCLFGSSLSPIVLRKVHVLFTLFVFVWFVFISSCFKKGSCLIYVICVCLLIVVFNTYCVFFCLFVIIFYIVCPILPVSLDCPFFIAPSALSTDPAVNYFPESGTYISILCDYFIFNIWYQQSYDLIIWSPTKTINFFKCLYLIIC